MALSCVGIMFAPHHQQAADELARVVRPGGRIGLLSWTPEGFIGRMFATMKPFAPAPPPGAQPPPLWGDEAHVRELLGDRVTDVVAQKRRLPVGRLRDGEQFRDFFRAWTADRGRLDRPAMTRAAPPTSTGPGRAGGRGARDGGMEWEYLLVTARRG